MSKKRKLKGAGSAFKAPVSQYPGTVPYVLKTPKQVMEINGVNIYGASVYDISKIPDLGLVIDLSDITTPVRHLVTGNPRAQKELPSSLFENRMSIIYIGWEDGSAHSLSVVWWETLVSVIEELPEGSSVAVCCVGGTGRTGTALAVLAGLTDQLGPDELDPVAWVRAHYYDDAVETEKQLHYVEIITGFCVSAEPSGLCGPMIYPHGTQGSGTQVVLRPPGAPIAPLGAPSSLGASDHTGS